MMRASALGAGVRKEARALWLPWAASAVTLAVVAADPERFGEVGSLAYGLGSISLAAMSVGHEYTNRTLPLLLSLPADRRQLLLVKLGVVTPMLGTLGALALVALPASTGAGPSPFPMMWVVSSMVRAVWLTLLCRSPLGGTVFAIGVTGQLHLVADVAGIIRFGWASTVIEKGEFTLSVLWWMLLAAGAVAAIGAWRAFQRLEAIDGRGLDVQWPRWPAAKATPAAAGAAPFRRPLWRLVQKELRLQQMSFVVAGMHVIGWSALSAFYRNEPDAPAPLAVVGAIYAGSLALLIGSLASAEERRMGTLEWHAMLPVAARTQWVIKTGTVMVLAVLLSFVLPVLLNASDSGVRPWHAGAILLLAIGSLFVSSLSDSGLRALVLSAPLTIIALWSLGWAWGMHRLSMGPLVQVALAAFALLTLWLAFDNHQRARMDPARLGRQVAWMTTAAALVALVVMV